MPDLRPIPMTRDEWLDLCPLDDLKAALLRRGDHVVVATLPPEGGIEENAWAWRGDHLRVVGLLEELKQAVLKAHQEAKL